MLKTDFILTEERRNESIDKIIVNNLTYTEISRVAKMHPASVSRVINKKEACSEKRWERIEKSVSHLVIKKQRQLRVK